MNSQTLRQVLLISAFFAASGGLASGQTIIIDPDPGPDPSFPPPRRIVPPHPRPVPPPRPPRPPQRNVPLEVRKYHVDTSIVDGVAVTGVDQVFFNPHDRPIEGTYVFPLDDDVALSKFTMFVKG